MNIYTLGYTGRQMTEIVELVEELDGVLVDVRLVPFSRAPMWQKRSFIAAFLAHEGAYRHMKGFGNLNYKRPAEGVKLSDPEMHMPDVRQIVASGKSPIFMCACVEATGCHRRHVAHYVAEQLRWPDATIEHIPPAAKVKKQAKGRVTGQHSGPMPPPSQRDLFGI
jgi:uncharacterized protein (DUF488 family)